MQTTTITTTNLASWYHVDDLKVYAEGYITHTLGNSLLDYDPMCTHYPYSMKPFGLFDEDNVPLLSCLAYYRRSDDHMLIFIGVGARLDNAAQLTAAYDHLAREIFSSYKSRR